MIGGPAVSPDNSFVFTGLFLRGDMRNISQVGSLSFLEKRNLHDVVFLFSSFAHPILFVFFYIFGFVSFGLFGFGFVVPGR